MSALDDATDGDSPREPAEKAERARILVAIGDSQLGARLTRMLSRRWDVETVADVRAALVDLRSVPPDLIVAELAGLGDDGLTLLRAISEDERFPDLPVIFLVEADDEDAAFEALNQGASDYLVKPFSDRQLEVRVAARLAHVQRDLEALDLRYESENRFRLLAGAVPLMMWVGNSDAECVDVSQPWLDYTGRTREQAVGLRWVEAVHPADRDRCLASFRKFFDAREPVELEYRLRRADGSYGWILDRGVPRYGPAGEFAGYVGWCSDISKRRDSEERLRRVQALTAALSRALTPEQVAAATVDYGMRAVGASAAWLARVDADDRTLRLLSSGGTQPKLWPRLAGQPVADVPALERVVVSGEPVWIETATDIRRQLAVSGTDVPGALAVLPVLIDSTEPGCLGLCLPEERTFSIVEQDDARLVARLAEQALARASRYAAERRVARTLQRNLLPHHLGQIEGVESAARYLPGTGEVEVGGDWYQVLPLSDDRIAVVVGDVAGHGIQAAVTMGILRNALNAYLLEGHDPGEALERTSRLLEHADERTMATAFCGVLDRATRVFEHATAGHPPPVLRDADGSVRLLEGPKRIPLGLASMGPTPISRVELPVGSLLVGYTDGLIERRRESLDRGLERLLESVRTGPDNVNTLSDHLIQQLSGPTHDDDIALLVLGIGRRVTLDLSVDVDAVSLSGIRRLVTAWLNEYQVPASEVQDVVLAVGESCANVALHAYDSETGTPADAAPRMRLTLRLEGETVRVRVQDSGSWRKTGRGIGGRGIPIMRKVMDSVDIASEEEGTTVEMRRRLSIGQRR